MKLVRRWIGLLLLAGALLGATGCRLAGAIAKESALTLTEHHGLHGFTLVGDLPAQFGLRATGWYGPSDKTRLHCQTMNIYSGDPMPRIVTKSFDISVMPHPQEARRRIPLTYHVGACRLDLGRVELKIQGRYGEHPSQKTYIGSTFYLWEKIPGEEPDFDQDGVRRVDRQCSWRFYESKLHRTLSKSLACDGEATFYLQRREARGKTVKLAIGVSPLEAPANTLSWIEVPGGWKPCVPKHEFGIACLQPVQFKTFRMNDQTCSIYPGCTEQQNSNPDPLRR